MRSKIEPRFARYAFDSLSDMQRWIEETPRTWGRVNEGEDESVTSKRWDLNAGYKGALDMARNGWLEGAQRAEEALHVFTPRDPAPDTTTDFYGHLPHVARYCAGAPDNMIRHSPKATMGGGRVLNLYVPINALSRVSAEHMSNFGLGVAQYINQIEQQGIRVELFGMIVSRMDDMRLAHTWNIKRADQPLDLAVLSFSIGHPAMFRRLGFCLYERSPSKPCSSYGRTEAATLNDILDAANGSYILNGMSKADTVAYTPAKALEYIAAQIERALDNPQAE